MIPLTAEASDPYSYVAQGTREMGIRVALGADAGGVRWLVLRRGLQVVLPGLCAGSLVALAVARTLRGLLFEVGTTDPLTFLAAPLVLFVAALCAVYVPARRATKIAPALILRND